MTSPGSANEESSMRRLLPLKVALVSLAIAACVTINVYFPAAAAEKAADQIIDAVTSRGVALPVTPAPAGPPTSRNAAPATQSSPALVQVVLYRALTLLIPVAHAQQANLDVSTPEVRALTASMQQRFAQLTPFFSSGAIGLRADGMIDERDQSAVPLPDRATVKRLVAEDNQDRAALYAAIAKGNAHPEWESEIRRTFARRWIERGAQPGWYYQDASGAWTRK
jgi:uncharacterized protein YdbL (DUF1318 family)